MSIVQRYYDEETGTTYRLVMDTANHVVDNIIHMMTDVEEISENNNFSSYRVSGLVPMTSVSRCSRALLHDEHDRLGHAEAAAHRVGDVAERVGLGLAVARRRHRWQKSAPSPRSSSWRGPR